MRHWHSRSRVSPPSGCSSPASSSRSTRRSSRSRLGPRSSPPRARHSSARPSRSGLLGRAPHHRLARVSLGKATTDRETEVADMTDQHHESTPPADGSVLPDDLLAARDRVAKSRVRARRTIGRGRTRRRWRPQTIAVAAVLFTLGAADRFVQGAVPAPTAPAAALPLTRSGSASSATQALAQISQTLPADQRAINALAVAQARLAPRRGGAGGDGGGSSAGTGIQLPSLPSIGSLPTIPVPAATSVPTVSATTGASVVVP